MKSEKHFAYMVRCKDNSIYSGYAVNPYKREEVHNSGKGAKYTRNRLPVKLVYFEEFEVGQEIRHSLSKTIFESDNNFFSLLTMNHHPVHTKSFLLLRHL